MIPSAAPQPLTTSGTPSEYLLSRQKTTGKRHSKREHSEASIVHTLAYSANPPTENSHIVAED